MRLRRFMPILVIVAALALPRVAHAQDCFLVGDFDPKPSSTMVLGSEIPGAALQFRSPEHTDPDLVWWIGDATTLDGCIGGIAPGSGAPTGKLEAVVWSDYTCLRFDVSATVPYTVDHYDAGGALLSSVTGSSPTFELPPNPATWQGHRVVFTPGDLSGGGRDALCVDNMAVAFPGLPVRPNAWGALKTLYR
jgi:hypothetical protein